MVGAPRRQPLDQKPARHFLRCWPQTFFLLFPIRRGDQANDLFDNVFGRDFAAAFPADHDLNLTTWHHLGHFWPGPGPVCTSEVRFFKGRRGKQE
jgi:hypothetical protein